MNLELPSGTKPGTTFTGSSLRQQQVILVSHGFGSNYERGFVNGLAQNRCGVTLVCWDLTDFAAIGPEPRTIKLRVSK